MLACVLSTFVQGGKVPPYLKLFWAEREAQFRSLHKLGLVLSPTPCDTRRTRNEQERQRASGKSTDSESNQPLITGNSCYVRLIQFRLYIFQILFRFLLFFYTATEVEFVIFKMTGEL